jgi:hypothetical protein
VDKFQNNDEEYLKIRKTVEEKAIVFLSGRKELLMLAPLSLADSMRNHPYKYSSLIYYITSSSTTDISSQYYSCYTYGQQQYLRMCYLIFHALLAWIITAYRTKNWSKSL